MMNYAEFKAAMQNEAMQKELAAFLAEKKTESGKDRILAIVEFAAGKGYEVTAEDLSLEAVNGKELSDDELGGAAGGEWCWNDYSCFAISFYDKCEQIMESHPEQPPETCGQAQFDYDHWKEICGASMLIDKGLYRY